MAVYGYCRVSTDEQARDGNSLPTQERRIAGFAMQEDWIVDETFVERGVSGSVPLADRPEGGRLLAAVKPADIIITPKMDRMFRSSTDALNNDTVRSRLSRGRDALRKLLDMGGTPFFGSSA